jgi:hypothetical protein
MCGWVGAKEVRFFWIVMLTMVPLKVLCQTEISEVPELPGKQFEIRDFEDLISRTTRFKAEAKILSLQPLTYGLETWDRGSWGRGYFTEIYSPDNPSKILIPFTVKDSLRYWGCHPLIRHSGRMARAHIQVKSLYPRLDNQYQIYDAIDYLLAQQQEDGCFPYYKYRADSTDLSARRSTSLGEEEYETSEALRAMADAYLYFSNVEEHYKKDTLYAAIQQSARWLMKQNNGWRTWKNNSNIPGFALWALSAAYKTNQDSTYQTTIKNICNILINRQHKEGINAGLWLTGSIRVVNGDSIIHDTKIWYHAIIVRGLIEALDVIPDKEKELRAALVETIKRAVNHIINFRLREESPSVKEYPGAKSTYSIGGEAFFEMCALLAYNSHFHNEFSSADQRKLINLLNRVSINLSKEVNSFYQLQNFNGVAYYSNYLDAINTKRRVLHWQSTSVNEKEVRMSEVTVSGDFDNDSLKNNIAFFSETAGEGVSIQVYQEKDGDSHRLGKTRWAGSESYSTDSIKGRVFSGDFDEDGKEDDLISFYEKGKTNFEIHRWTFDSGNFKFSQVFENFKSYNIENINNKSVCGDFDQDGYKDDIAAFYGKIDGNTKIHVWRYDADSMAFVFDKGEDGWWSKSSFLVDNIAGRLVVGDFDRDGFDDDLAAFYINESNDKKKSITIEVWRSDGTTFRKETKAWWNSGPSPVPVTENTITYNLVAGDFNNNGYNDEIAAFFEKSLGKRKPHIWESNGTDAFYFCPATLPETVENETRRIEKVLLGSFNATTNGVSTILNFPVSLSKFYGWKLRPVDLFRFPGDIKYQVSLNCKINIRKSIEVADSIADTNLQKLQRDYPKNLSTYTLEMSIYPNPTSGRFNIKVNTDFATSVEIVSFFGKTIYKNNLDATMPLSIDLTHQPTGTYFVLLRNGTNLETRKLLIK